MPLADLAVGRALLQWRCHLSPSELPVVAVDSALGDSKANLPFNCLVIIVLLSSLLSFSLSALIPCLFIRQGAQTLAIYFVSHLEVSLSIPRKSGARDGVLVTELPCFKA